MLLLYICAYLRLWNSKHGRLVPTSPDTCAQHYMVQKYGVCIEVGIVKIVAYSCANSGSSFIWSFSRFLSLDLHHVQFTNVPLSEYCVGEFPQLDFSLFLLSSCSFLYLNLNLVVCIENERVLFHYSPAYVKTGSLWLFRIFRPLCKNIIFIFCFMRATFSIFLYYASFFFSLILGAQDVSRCLSKSLFYRLSIS